MQGDELLEKLTTNVEALQTSCNYELEKQGEVENLEYANMASWYSPKAHYGCQRSTTWCSWQST